MNEILRKQVFGIMQGAVNIDPASLDPDKNLREQVNLDSMQFVAVLAKLENDLDIELPISAMEARSLNDFLAILEKEYQKKGLGT